MVQTAPALFVFCFLQIAVHLLLILGAGRMAGFSRKELLLASNANVGGGRCLAACAEAALAMLTQDTTYQLWTGSFIKSCLLCRVKAAMYGG